MLQKSVAVAWASTVDKLHQIRRPLPLSRQPRASMWCSFAKTPVRARLSVWAC